jgi:hypothetical protein
MSAASKGSFADGFEVGYRLIKGLYVGTPGMPGYSGAPAGSSAYLEGIKAGIKAAGGTLIKPRQ